MRTKIVEPPTLQSLVPTDLPDGLNFRIRVKSACGKYFAFTEIKFSLYSHRPAPQEGRFAIVTDVGRGMRWTHWLRKTSAAGADGEVVWS
jgi:hypothetical protein